VFDEGCGKYRKKCKNPNHKHYFERELSDRQGRHQSKCRIRQMPKDPSFSCINNEFQSSFEILAAEKDIDSGRQELFSGRFH